MAFFLTTGCLGTAESEATPDAPPVDDPPPVQPTSGLSGCGGINGFDALSLHTYKATVHDSMDEPLAQFSLGAWKVRNTAANQGLLANLLQGRETLRYAVKCALSAGDSVAGGLPSENFPGDGLLATAAAWKTTSLNTARKEDLFSCMLAHLNSLGIHVPFMLSGPSVTNSPSFDGTPYDFDEALWATEITYGADDSPSLNFYVWPSEGLTELCLDLTGVLHLRLCGTALGTCDLTVRDDKASACSETASGWTCDGRPAIQTRLRSADVPLLYGICL